jgi:hypothetical protein
LLQNGKYLDSCISLGNDCGYSASEDDCVYLVRENDALLPTPSEETAEYNVKSASADLSTEFIMELQVLLHTCSYSWDMVVLYGVWVVPSFLCSKVDRKVIGDYVHLPSDQYTGGS